MKLFDGGLTVILVVAALLAANYAGKKYSPQYKAGYDRVVAKVVAFEKKYVDPYRTPEDGIDDPVFEAK